MQEANIAIDQRLKESQVTLFKDSNVLQNSDDDEDNEDEDQFSDENMEEEEEDTPVGDNDDDEEDDLPLRTDPNRRLAPPTNSDKNGNVAEDLQFADDSDEDLLELSDTGTCTNTDV